MAANWVIPDTQLLDTTTPVPGVVWTILADVCVRSTLAFAAGGVANVMVVVLLSPAHPGLGHRDL